MQTDCWQSVLYTVFLFNFGGPESEREVHPFLLKLFEDPFIIRAPIGNTLRKFLAKRIAKKRAPKAAHEYAKIGFSPINSFTKDQATNLEYALKKIRPSTKVVIVNRYTAPFATDVVKSLKDTKGRFFMLSLYPHVCHSTTVSSYRDFDLALNERFDDKNFTTTRIFSWWHNPAFLDYSASQVWKKISEISHSSDEKITVLFSAHGIPKKYQQRGDPYVNEIYAHFEEIKQRCEVWKTTGPERTKATAVDWNLAFQSRVGPVEWTKPYTEESIVSLGKNKGTLLIVPISFVSDHIETLFEMDHTYRELALQSGFASYQRVSPPNSDPTLAECLSQVLIHHGF